MAYKKKLQNKSEKKVVADKAPSIDWSTVSSPVTIIALKSKHMVEGKEYSVTKETAQILAKKGEAKLK